MELSALAAVHDAAAFLKPLLSLADLYEAMKKPDLAIKVYQRLPAKSPLRRNADIQLATDLDALNRTAEATKHLEKLIANNPKDIEAIVALGNILRARKKFADCADVYSKGIAAMQHGAFLSCVKRVARDGWH